MFYILNLEEDYKDEYTVGLKRKCTYLIEMNSLPLEIMNIITSSLNTRRGLNSARSWIEINREDFILYDQELTKPFMCVGILNFDL